MFIHLGTKAENKECNHTVLSHYSPHSINIVRMYLAALSVFYELNQNQLTIKCTARSAWMHCKENNAEESVCG